MHVHSHTDVQREKGKTERDAYQARNVGGWRVAESQKERHTKRETEMGRWRGSAMREIDQRGKTETFDSASSVK